jgi:exopolysaccharide biosynthesis polyprenyl glycosylphosphotransferase
MLKEHSSLIQDIQKFIDIGIAALSFLLAYYIKKNILPEKLSGLAIGPNYYVLLLLIIIAWHLSFKWMGMYISYREKPFRQFFIAILKSNFLGMTLVSIALYFLHIQDISRWLILIFLGLNISLLTLAKFITFKVLERIRTDGLNIRNILVVGSKARAKELIEAVEKYRATGYKILGCFDVDETQLGKPVFNDHRVIGLAKDLEKYLRQNIVDELIFAMPLKKLKKGNRALMLAESLGINIRIIPDWELHHLMYRPGISKIRIDDFLGIYTLSLQSTPHNEGAILIKHFFDFMAALILIIVLLPLFMGISLAIKIFSKGDVLYQQERLGMNGRRFLVYKFRTMVSDADERLKELARMNEADGPVFKIKDDPRIIPHVGTFLRKYSLDELPQLFNVLKSQMSLVGPRPPIPKEVTEYSVWQRRRLSMKPGMTCWWQIAPNRNELSFDEWMKLDLKYIDNWSLLNDMIIIIATAKTVLTGTGR